MDSDDDGDDIGYDDALVGRDDIGYDYGFKPARSETDDAAKLVARAGYVGVEGAHKRLNDSVGLGRARMGNGVSDGPVDRHDSIEYLRPARRACVMGGGEGEQVRAAPRVRGGRPT